MVRSDADTVEHYLAEIPDDRRADVEMVREMILANLPEGFGDIGDACCLNLVDLSRPCGGA